MDRRERGTALVVVLIAMVLMSAVGITLVLSTSAETRIAGNFRSAQEALYAAEAGANRAIADLRSVPDWSLLPGGTILSSFADGAPSGTRQLDDGSMLDLVQTVNLANCEKPAGCTDSEMNASTEDRPWGANNPRWKLFAYGRIREMLAGTVIDSPHYVVVMVGDDPGETDNDPSQDGAAGSSGAGVFAVRSEAFGPSSAHKVVELTFTRSGAAVRLLSWRELR